METQHSAMQRVGVSDKVEEECPFVSTTMAKRRLERIRRFSPIYLYLGTYWPSEPGGIVRGPFLQGRDRERQKLRVQEGHKQQRLGEKSREDPMPVSR